MSQVSAPHPPFIPARWHGASINGPIHRIVIHGTVGPCRQGAARDVAAYFHHERTDRHGKPIKTSAHYVVDPTETIQCVGDHAIAYHAPPNTHSIGVELCDPQAGLGRRWRDREHTMMLDRASRLVARLCLAYGVPAHLLDVEELRAGREGICGHVDVSHAWHETTHTDPGPDFPWKAFMDSVRGHRLHIATVHGIKL